MPAPGSTDGEVPEDESPEDERPEDERPEVDRSEPAGSEEAPAGLCTAELVVVGRMPWSSNATFLCDLVDVDGDVVGRAIYKPHQGERPLWDFPDGLYRREVATYELARALRWDLVPETVERDGPYGVGSVQEFVDADFEQHYFTLLEDEQFHDQLRRLCAFDIVANSTDRKAGHVLVDEHGHLWGIDNGLSLHAEFKLRTVIWDFAGEPLPSEVADDLAAFIERPLPAAVADVLDAFERDAVRTRALALLSEGRFPHDHTGRRYPWPLV